MNPTQKRVFLGVMSGTSLDGLDLALCTFKGPVNKPVYAIVKASTIPYPTVWKKRLMQLAKVSAQDYFEWHHLYGNYIAEQCLLFLNEAPLRADFIASHGHTIFHQPAKGFSTQLGCGATIAAVTGISTVCDFRSLDVALGGQGAPLVPIGDALLFGHYEACLNLGGIANISFEKNKTRLAFDICFVNMALNYLSEQVGQAFDKDGQMARRAKPNANLVNQLQQIHKAESYPSLGREIFEQSVKPLLLASACTVEEQLASVVRYAVHHIQAVIQNNGIQRCLVTGGGAYNTFLMEQLTENNANIFEVPDATTVAFKEALVFAFLGYLRVCERVNTLTSVTKASVNSVGGAVYFR